MLSCTQFSWQLNCVGKKCDRDLQNWIFYQTQSFYGTPYAHSLGWNNKTGNQVNRNITFAQVVITSLPLKKARSSIGADRGSGLTRPMLYPPPWMPPPSCQPSTKYIRTKVKPPPHGKCYPPMEVATPPMESATPPLRCMAMVAAKYIGLWGQISSLSHWSMKRFPEEQFVKWR